MNTIKTCRVCDGHTLYVRPGKPLMPGTTVVLEEEEMERLVALGVVSLVEMTDQERLITAIGRLSVDDTSLWTKSGEPQTSALENLVGFEVSAPMRDQAWEEYQGNEE